MEHNSVVVLNRSNWEDVRQILSQRPVALAVGAAESPQSDELARDGIRFLAQALFLLGTCSRDELSLALNSEAAGSLEALLAALAIGELTEELIEQAVELGQQLHEHGELVAEQQLMELLAKARPDFYWPWFVLGRNALAAGAALDAVRFLGKSIAFNPEFAWSHLSQFRALVALDERPSALGHLDTALKLMPSLHATVVEERLRLLPRFRWTVAHAEMLDDLLRMPSLSHDVVQELLDVMSGMLLPEGLGSAEAEHACAADVGRLLLASEKESRLDFRLLPLHYMTALAIVPVNPRLANELLATFDQRMPDMLNFADLPEMFERFVRLATEGLLHTLYLRNLSKVPHMTLFCMRVADLQHRVFRNAGLARLVYEAGVSGALSHAHRDTETLRLLCYCDEKKWFEVLNNLAGRSAEEIRNSSQILKVYVSAIFALTNGREPLMLAAARQLLDLIRRTARPSEALDSVSEQILAMIREGIQGIYRRLKAHAVTSDPNDAVACWEKWLTVACDLVDQFEALRVSGGAAPTGALEARGEVLILTSPYLPQVLHYRGEQLLELLEAASIPAALIDLVRTPIQSLHLRALKAGTVIVQRQPATFEVVRFLAWCRQMGVRTIYDIDDQIFDSRISPLPLSDYAGRIDRETHIHLRFDCGYFREAMLRCDEIMVSTEPLRSQVEAILPTPTPVHVRRNMIGLPLRTARIEARIAKAAAEDAKSGPLEVFYGSGTKAHKAYFDETVLPALVHMLRVREQVRVTVFGEFDLDLLPADVADRFVCERRMLDYEAYLKRLSEADISIAPLDSNPVTDGKSELKWFEAACLGIPSVVSPTCNYWDVLRDGTHALFANTEAEWSDALIKLVDDPERRAQLVENSLALIAEDYEISSMARPLVETLRLQPPAGDHAKVRQRLLVVNTYFKPQSIGGATRIAESYVQDLLKRYGGQFEIFVLCADAAHRTSPPYGLTVLRQDGVTVLRCAVPQRDWADALDPKVEELTRDIVADLGIDVAHVHSVQILTASVVDALVKARVPVVLSLHDAWWLSEHQFLVDDDGKAFLPHADASDLAETTCRRMTLKARLGRRATLTRILRQCSRRLAVSEAFAEVYRQAGIAHVEVLENGVDLPLPVTTRREAAPHDPLRIGFIGGLSAHKGYVLLEQVVRSEHLPNLEFVLVDHRYEQGYERESRWGASRVIYIGKTSQSRVAEVYARFDVLAAPSIWPESYGLVAREARALGVPVIAGNLGDIGRGIQPGRDGWLVDVKDDQGLRALLRQFNADPASGRIAPAIPSVVSVPEAVDRLVALLSETV